MNKDFDLLNLLSLNEFRSYYFFYQQENLHFDLMLSEFFFLLNFPLEHLSLLIRFVLLFYQEIIEPSQNPAGSHYEFIGGVTHHPAHKHHKFILH